MDRSKKKNVRSITLCAIPSCKNTPKMQPNIAYHLFPKDEKIRQAWLSKCQGMDKFNPAHSRICSNHFSSDDYIRDLRNELLGMPTRKILKPTSIPSLFLPIDDPPKMVFTRIVPKKQRIKKKGIKKTILKSTPSANDVAVKNKDVSNVTISTLLPEHTPDVQKSGIDWKEKYNGLQDRYAKLEKIVMFWKSKSKNQQQKSKSKKTTLPKPKETIVTKTDLQDKD